jgi:hypothetical protein
MLEEAEEGLIDGISRQESSVLRQMCEIRVSYRQK